MGPFLFGDDELLSGFYPYKATFEANNCSAAKILLV